MLTCKLPADSAWNLAFGRRSVSVAVSWKEDSSILSSSCSFAFHEPFVRGRLLYVNELRTGIRRFPFSSPSERTRLNTKTRRLETNAIESAPAAGKGSSKAL